MLTEEDYRFERFIQTYFNASDTNRSFLHNEEAYLLVQSHPYAKLVTQDLNLTGYMGKWKRALERQIKSGIRVSCEFWMNARTYFLELGGDYKEEFRPNVCEKV